MSVRMTCGECGYTGTYRSQAHGDYSLSRHSCKKELARQAARRRGRARMRAVDRTPKPCRHKIANHQHGTYACYVLDACRCLPCAFAQQTYESDRVRRHAYGRWNGLVDAQPAREHVRDLMAAGVGLKRIVALSGVSSGSIWKLVYGKKDAEGVQRPAKRIKPSVEARLLAVRPDAPGVLAGGVRIDGTGTRRRLQALVAKGWSQSKLSAELGMFPGNFKKIIAGDRETTVATAAAVHALYDRLWDTAPPEYDHRSKISVSRARNVAKARGWALPLAWDDDTIDDPTAQPASTAIVTDLKRKLPPVDELRWLIGTGESIAAIASRFGVSEDGVLAALRRSPAA